MEQNLPRDSNSHSACQEISRLLWNLRVHYHVHKNLPLLPLLSHINNVHIFPHYFPKIHSNIIFPSTPSYFLEDFWPKFCVHFSCFSCVLHAPPVSSSFDFIALIWWRSSLDSVLQPPDTSKYSPQQPVAWHSLLCSSLSVKDQIPQPYKTTRKI